MKSLWKEIPAAPAWEELEGHPTWWFEDPLTSPYALREPSYPVEKLSVTVSNLKRSAYVLHERSAVGWSLYPLPFVRYLSGVPVEQLAREFEEHRAFVRPKIRVVKKAWEPWYGSLAVLLGNTEAVTWLFRLKTEKNFLFDSFMGHRPLTPTYPVEARYRRLREAVELQVGGQPEAAAELLYAYVDEDWYDEHAELAWHGTYDKLSGFIGYWCYEAAAMSVIHGIDDTALKAHPHYPTDLAAYGRSGKSPT